MHRHPHLLSRTQLPPLPFQAATRRTQDSTLAALDVESSVIPSENTPLNIRNSSGLSLAVESLSLPTDDKFASISTFSVNDANNVPTLKSVPSVEPLATTLSHKSVDRLHANEVFENLSTVPFLEYTDFYPNIIHRPPLIGSTPEYNEIYNRIVTPYSADGFELLLSDCNLTQFYPLLVRNL